ncbi:MAG: hypothetical protein ACXWFB_11930 [Nitrososphaeraceae archaeon]
MSKPIEKLLFLYMKDRILDEIIVRGGLLGIAAGFCKGNDDLTDKFILECYEQIHTSLAKEIWGNDLIKQIENYSKKMKVKRT